MQNPITRAFSLCFIILLSATLISCASTENEEEIYNSEVVEPEPEIDFMNQIAISPGYESMVEVNQPVLIPSAAGRPMQVMTPVINKAERDLKIQYKYTWYDLQARELQQVQGWFLTDAASGAITMLAGQAITDKAADWALEIRIIESR